MKAEPVLFAVAASILFSCNPAPTAAESSPAPAATAVAPKDTVIDRYERKEVKEIKRDTTKVQTPR